MLERTVGSSFKRLSIFTMTLDLARNVPSEAFKEYNMEKEHFLLPLYDDVRSLYCR